MTSWRQKNVLNFESGRWSLAHSSAAAAASSSSSSPLRIDILFLEDYMVAWLIMAASSVTSLLTESQRWRITALARVTQTKIYMLAHTHTHTHTHTHMLVNKRKLSVGHGEYRTNGTYCICSRDPALPASDNRITANWTLEVFSLSLLFFLPLNHSVFPPVSPPPLLPLGFTSSWKIIFHLVLLELLIHRERRSERGSGSEDGDNEKMDHCWAEW